MARLRWTVVPALLIALAPPAAAAAPDRLADLRQQFREHTGCELVFDAADLPAGSYFDKLVPLAAADRETAAEIAVREARKLPRGFHKTIGLKATGVFAACVHSKGDGYRPKDAALGGYRYYGLFNSKDAVVAAMYTRTQLPLTLHHEWFHAVDAAAGRNTRDQRFADLLAGRAEAEALRLDPADLRAIKAEARGAVLEEAVSSYAAKSPGEDKAETARWVMSNLPDALVQLAERPTLPGSRRISHILAMYKEVVPAADTAHFVAIALGRAAAEKPAAPAEKAARLPELADPARVPDITASAEEARRLVAEMANGPAPTADAVRAAATVTRRLLAERVRSRGAFVIHGREAADGVNHTLRGDLSAAADDAKALGAAARRLDARPAEVDAALQANMDLLAEYRQWMARRWTVTGGTAQKFDESAAACREALSPEAIERLKPPRPPAPAPGGNKYLENVDAGVKDPDHRAAIRRAQPACVGLSTRSGAGSGVNLSPAGLVLTAAHCVEAAGGVGTAVSVEFPDGRKFTGQVSAVSAALDLALVKLKDAAGLPAVRLADQPAEVGDWIACVHQPAREHNGTAYPRHKPWHVSEGHVRGRRDDALSDQRKGLGAMWYDCWTFWGTSGAPLFNTRGELVGVHNTWNSKTADRHGVPQEAIRAFLIKSGELKDE
jgi:S1-C subfamily serine protease